MKLKVREHERPEIPTASMGDIATLLIIFFMLTTVFREERGLHVSLPKAIATRKLPKKNIAHIWVNRDGVISIDDRIVTPDMVYIIMQRKVMANPNIIVSILMDKDCRYGVLAKIFDALREAEALRVSLATLKEKGG